MKDQSLSTLHVSQSAGRALGLLDAVISAGPIGLGEVATRLDMPSSTALRHLRALVAGGWLSQDDDGRYGPGPTSVRLALRVTGDGPFARLIAAATPALETLVAATGESAYLAIRDGSEAVYLALAESPRAIRHTGWVGRSVPVEGTAVGESLLADVAPGGPVPVAENVGALESDVSGVTAPVAVDGRVVAALSVLGPADRFDASKRRGAAATIADAAAALGTQLGDQSVQAGADAADPA
ncbi:MAG: helix-turn-helix domain-containing protein [Actinomycetota bacterium]